MPAALTRPDDRPVRLLDIGDARDHAAFAGDVERRGPQDRAALDRFGLDVDDNDLLALSGEQRCGRRTNAAAAAGDENDTLGVHMRLPSGLTSPRVISFS